MTVLGTGIALSPLMILNQIEQTDSIKRLRQVVEQRYGKSLKLSFLNDSHLLDCTKDASYFVRLGDLKVPIIVNGQFLATAVIPDAHDLDAKDHLALAHLAQMVLEPLCYNLYLENKVQSLNAPEMKASENVVELFYQDRSEEFIDKKSSPGSAVVCLRSLNPHRSKKVAELIHEISGRWASLPFQEIESQICTLEDIKTLGFLTLFVPDLLELKPEHQTILAQYSKIADRNEDPLVIVGSTLSSDDLPAFLAKNQLEVDRLPLNLASLRETLELMMD